MKRHVKDHSTAPTAPARSAHSSGELFQVEPGGAAAGCVGVWKWVWKGCAMSVKGVWRLKGA
jgi:hypothetical protein